MRDESEQSGGSNAVTAADGEHTAGEGMSAGLRLEWPGRDDSMAGRTLDRALAQGARGTLVATDGMASTSDFTENSTASLVLRGDNLAALALLGERAWGQADMVYLDPPYNTGNLFMYRDRHGTRGETNHVAWLNMLVPRLIAARRLLCERGFLCVSIDEHEVHHLRVVLDELFGASNRVETIIVSMNAKGRQLGSGFARTHEYVLIYAKHLETCAIRTGLADAVDPRDFPKHDARGAYRLLPLRNTNKKFNPETRPNLAFPLHVDRDTGGVFLETGAGRERVTPVFGSGAPAVWRWGKAKIQSQRDELFGRQVNGQTGRRWDVFQKDYNLPGRTKKLTSIWLPSEIGSTDAAARELKAHGVAQFDTPKPLGLMERLCALTPDDARIFDLFAGSGTTGEAVMRLNHRDGTTRSFVLVQREEAIDGGPSIADLLVLRLEAAATALRDEMKPGDREPGFRTFRVSHVD